MTLFSEVEQIFEVVVKILEFGVLQESMVNFKELILAKYLIPYLDLIQFSQSYL